MAKKEKKAKNNLQSPRQNTKRLSYTNWERGKSGTPEGLTVPSPLVAPVLTNEHKNYEISRLEFNAVLVGFVLLDL